MTARTRKSLASRERELEREQERLQKEQKRLAGLEAKRQRLLEERARTLRERHARESASLRVKNVRAFEALKRQQNRKMAALFKKQGRQMVALYRKHGHEAPPEPEAMSPRSGPVRFRHVPGDEYYGRYGNGPARSLSRLIKEAPDSSIARAWKAFANQWPVRGLVEKTWFVVDEGGQASVDD